MPKVIGWLCALSALAASVLSHAEPLTALARAGIAFIAGLFLTQVWYVFFATQMAPPRQISEEEDKAA